VLREIDDHDPWPEEQSSLQAQICLIVQEMLPPVGNHKLRQDDAQSVLRVAFVNGINIARRGWMRER
jgi:hypothetical protein